MQRNRGIIYLARLAVSACTAVWIATNVVSSAPVPRQPADSHAWKTYTNVRFHYSICYPDDLFVPQGESANSDGQRFVAKDGGEFIVFGNYNALNESPKKTFADTAASLAGPSGKGTYKVLKPNWFVVSGQNGPIIFYAKTLHSHDTFKSFELTYDGSAAAVYEPLIRRIAAC